MNLVGLGNGAAWRREHLSLGRRQSRANFDACEASRAEVVPHERAEGGVAAKWNFRLGLALARLFKTNGSRAGAARRVVLDVPSRSECRSGRHETVTLASAINDVEGPGHRRLRGASSLGRWFGEQRRIGDCEGHQRA